MEELLATIFNTAQCKNINKQAYQDLYDLRRDVLQSNSALAVRYLKGLSELMRIRRFFCAFFGKQVRL